MLEQILSTYASFFDIEMWKALFSDPTSYGLILTLIIIEGLLSADNALVLAIMVKHLPEKQRKKALMYGLWGAYFFRFVFIGLGATLAKYSAIKILGAGYLFWISFKFFKEKFFDKNQSEDDDEEARIEKIKKGFLARYIGVFWATVASIELMDLAFSADSILAALAISDNVGILLLGGIFGILMMRGVASVFIKLLAKVPELEYTAFALIALIGTKMALSVAFPHFHISHEAFFALIGLSFLVTFIIHHFNKRKQLK